MGKLACYISKSKRKKSKQTKNDELDKLVAEVVAEGAPLSANDPPLTKVNSQILELDVMFLHLKEFDDNDPKPEFMLFGEGTKIKVAGCDIQGDYKISCDCDKCYLDRCDEYRYNNMLVQATR